MLVQILLARIAVKVLMRCFKLSMNMKKLTSKPILAQSNAGIPELVDGNLHYIETPEMIAPKVLGLLKSGVNILGGCCGTNPSHIKKMREVLDLFLSSHI